jgi:hypothetical protein
VEHDPSRTETFCPLLRGLLNQIGQIDWLKFKDGNSSIGPGKGEQLVNQSSHVDCALQRPLACLAVGVCVAGEGKRAGGRAFIPSHAFQDEWLAALPADLHPVQGGAHIKPVRILDAATEYMTKSPFHQHVEAEEATRIVQVIAATKGLQKFTTRGSMACPAQRAAA